MPDDLYAPSPRPYPQRLVPLTYPNHYEVRLVSKNGGVRWFNHSVNVSHLLGEQYVGFSEIDSGLFDVYFGPIWLGRFVEAKLSIFDNLGRPKRRRGGNFKGRQL